MFVCYTYFNVSYVVVLDFRKFFKGIGGVFKSIDIGYEYVKQIKVFVLNF